MRDVLSLKEMVILKQYIMRHWYRAFGKLLWLDKLLD
jgi:hypothetical protein